jgi:4-amino-4-deoxy-L-arabinose transferase-like glycosyltransferase
VNPLWTSAGGVGVLVFVASVALYAALAAPIPFYDKGEPREALVVRAIVHDHALVLPLREGRDIPSKPPLFHWLAALAVQSGIRPEELAVRWPSVVLGAAGVALAAMLAARAHGAIAGVLAALVLGSSFEWLRAATQSRVDMTLTFFVVVATLAWRAGVAGAVGPSAVRLGYLAAAAAVLTKGPVGVVLPLLVVGADALAGGEVRELRRLIDLPAAAGMAGVCVGWYALAWHHGGAEFAARHVVQENLQRFVGWGRVAHRHAIAYYVPALAGAFLPWTLALPLTVRRLWQRPGGFDRFLILWVLVVLAFFSLAAGKRSTYLLPLFPPLAVLTGAGLAATVQQGPGRFGRVALLAGAVATLAVALAVGLDAGALVLGRATGLLRGSDVTRLPAAVAVVHEHRVAIAATLATIGMSLVVLIARVPGGVPWRLGALATIAVAVSVGLTAFGTYPAALQLTTRAFAARVQGRLRPGSVLCACGYIDWPLRYYVGRTVPRCTVGLADGADGGLVIRSMPGTRGGQPRYRLERLVAGSDGAGPCASRPSYASAPGTPVRAMAAVAAKDGSR